MQQKLFVLGLPGSGKSTVIRYIVEHMRRHHKECVAVHHSDYDILLDMFQREQQEKPEHKHFLPTQYGGFYVTAPRVYDESLDQLEQKIKEAAYPEDMLVLIEFARSDYIRALSNFSKAFLRNAFFLFLEVDIQTGIKRVEERVKNPHSIDDHFVPRDRFAYYRSKDNAKYLSSVAHHLTRRYEIRPQDIKILDNKVPESDFEEPVSSFIRMIVSRSHSLT